MLTSLPYSSAIPTDAAEKFLTVFGAEYGSDALPGSGESVGGYNWLFMYKAAAEKAGTTAADEVAEALVGQSYDGPTDVMTMTDSHHVSQPMTIVKRDGSKNSFVSTPESLDPNQPACG
ncbi:ABC transporter substrate-binding protein [Saccharopolyspora pogona]|uniref:ABC transporter substrate-binding protein n=1 Tax=Saccharopolyspora pogona TaxID=333966 RepID=UPI001689A06D|nr:ABC transporter substrate-binding protein [Saccharopolyspora pogona]